MGPSKTNQIVSKRLSKRKDSPAKEGGRTAKTKVKKRKLSDMVGSRWGEEELTHFYEAYRKHGKDWKKVASVLPNRTVDMVEGLYKMNRAYLSLPDGMASVAGLIAMMTDHYNILDGSDSDEERNALSRTLCKPHRLDCGKLRDCLQHQSGFSTYGCLSLLKRNSGDLFADNRPRAVGKRTPRHRVSYLRETVGRAEAVSPDKQTSNNEHAYLAAPTLVEVSQRGGSLQTSDTSDKRITHTRSSSGQSGQRKDSETEILRTNDMVAGNENLDSLRSTQPELEVSSSNTRTLDTEATADTEVSWKVKKLQERPKGSAFESFQFDDVREACSATISGYDVIKNESDMDVTCEKSGCASQCLRKRSQLTRDESCALDALHTLADLSLSISLSSSAAVSESGTLVEKQEVDTVHEYKVPGSLSENHECSKSNTSVKGDGSYSQITGLDIVTQGSANLGKDMIAIATQKNYSSGSKMQNRKRKSLAEKVSTEDRKKSCVRQLVSLLKEGKSIETPEHPALSKDMGKSITESALQDPSLKHINMTVRSRNRRKMGLHKAIVQSESSEKSGYRRPNKYSCFVNDEAVDAKEMLSCCLSSKMLRRWCAFEWFYSAIDYPWFAKCEFQEYLDYVQLGHVPSLTRVEWGVIRSSLGKPRRLSQHFFLEERKRLELYRESVRRHYAELRAGIREELPTDLAQPLAVGQRVSAYHPKTREIHNGSVLSIDYDRCRVKFDRPDLGVELVLDVDCMPLNPWENMPDDLKNHNVVDELCNRFTGVKADVQFFDWKTHRSYGGTIAASGNAKNVAKPAAKQAMSHQACTLAQLQEREAEIKALADLSCAVNKKEALVTELRQMNEEVCGRQRDGDLIRDCEPLINQYAAVLVNLQNVNAKVASALVYLRQRNTYQGNLLPRSMVNLGTPAPNLDSGTFEENIVECSRQKAKALVSAAVQAMPSLKGKEDVGLRIGGLLSFSTNLHPGADSSLSRTRCFPHPINSSLQYQDQVFSCLFEPIKKASGISPMEHDSYKLSPTAVEAQHPSDLISACVASLLMIQSCAEGHHSPAEVARIMDSAVTSLQPSCSQNLPIYREIQTCMGIIKDQLLTVVPTPSSVFCAEVSV